MTSRTRPIRVAVLDPHPTVRAGIASVLAGQPDLVPAGAAGDAHDLAPLLRRTRPDVLLLAQPATSPSGLALCRRVSATVLAPRVVLCAPAPLERLAVAAALAGAAGLVDRSADLRVLLEAIRAVAGGTSALPWITPQLKAAAAARLGHRDRAIFAMRLAGTSPADLAATVGLALPEVADRVDAILAALVAGPVPARAAA